MAAAEQAGASPQGREAADDSPAARSSGAVVVSYHPDPVLLRGLLRALIPQVAHIVVVDNGSPAALLASLQIDVQADLRAVMHANSRAVPQADPPAAPGLEWLCLARNAGLGAAHNLGLARLQALGLRHLMLFDQDSEPAPDMVAQLVAAQRRLDAAGQRVAALGPVPVDRASGRRGHFVRMREHWVRQIAAPPPPGPDAPALPVDFLISSGCLIPADALHAVGPMNEDFFIDHVDTEWCHRARELGLGLWAVPQAQLTHALGEHLLRVWCGRWRHVAVHAPSRGYYVMRNTVLLLQTRPMGWDWRLYHLKRLLQRVLFFSLVTRPRLQRIQWLARGLWHGLQGRSGPYLD